MWRSISPPGRRADVAEQGEAALAEGDVDGVGEACAHAARGLRRRPGAEGVALDEQDVDAGLGEVERDRAADDAAADDDDLGARPGAGTARHRRNEASDGRSATSICAFCRRPL